jgi:hypothetical protein
MAQPMFRKLQITNFTCVKITKKICVIFEEPDQRKHLLKRRKFAQSGRPASEQTFSPVTFRYSS